MNMKKQTGILTKLSKEDLRLLEKLKDSIDNCLEILSDYAKETTVSINNNERPSELIKSCIAMGKGSDAFENKQPLRIIRHFACTGGTIISKSLSVMPNTLLLSELNP
jgi:hypothetical protein